MSTRKIKQYEVPYRQEFPQTCVITCLTAIFHKKGLDFRTTAFCDILEWLDFRNSPETMKIFPGRPLAESPKFYGCNVTDLNRQIFDKLCGSINTKLGCGLKEEYHSIKSILSSENMWDNNYLEQNFFIEDDDPTKDIIVYYDYAVITENQTMTARHASLIAGLYEDNVILWIPNETKNFYTNVKKQLLYEAMRAVNGGISEIINHR